MPAQPGYGAPMPPTQQIPATQPGPGTPPPPGFPPGPGGPVGPGGPGVPAGPGKSRTGLIVGVIVAAVVVVAGLGVGAYFLFANKTKTAAPEVTETTSTTKGSILSSTTKPNTGNSGTTDPLSGLLGDTGGSSGTDEITQSEMSCVESSLQNTLSPAEQKDLSGSNTSDATLQKVARAMDSCLSTQSQEAFYAKYIKQGLQRTNITVTDSQADCMARRLVSENISFADFVGGGTTATQQQIADAASSCGVNSN